VISAMVVGGGIYLLGQVPSTHLVFYSFYFWEKYIERKDHSNYTWGSEVWNKAYINIIFI